jgi:hypothetical protein
MMLPLFMITLSNSKSPGQHPSSRLNKFVSLPLEIKNHRNRVATPHQEEFASSITFDEAGLPQADY